ncbi:MAG: diaminopimelate epimerase [Bacteroidales bacterium]|nr:diaminopimelate epimerase [Bacteroidales bacterium]RLD39455.1 MAG: diaminopimelate epimerase [Bacteroidota bacterium]
MINFYKYHGAGNDFILIDGRESIPEISTQQIKSLCDRNFGVGGDGLMYLLKADDYDFEMKYFNSNGLEGSMCGNGGRCIVAFAYDMGINKSSFKFLATDGEHFAEILQSKGNLKYIKLQMQDVHEVEDIDDHLVLNTGSPHHLTFCKSISDKNVFEAGKAIRYSENFKKEGVNANFIEQKGNKLFVRTYERGVENETLACGTGVTAAAIGAYIKGADKYNNYKIKTLGGELKVSFQEKEQRFTEVFLEGYAEYVFKGSIQL